MTARRRSYLIQDPYDTDAQRFIAAMFRYFGMRPVCFYTDPKARYYGERAFPMLRSSEVEASFDVSLADLGPFAAAVQRKYDIAAIIPYREDVVEVAAELCKHLELRWNAPETIARFRDKHALKSYLRRHPVGVRVPYSKLVSTSADLCDGALPSKFVLKPNDGYGNRDVSIWRRDDDLSSARAAIDRGRTTWIVEEFMEGDEFEVDGQVRPDGRVDVLAVLRYRRTEVNGHPTVYYSLVQVKTHEPEFAVCEAYARKLMQASGLVASPFHMELKLDERGPAMIDLGARLPSDGGGEMLSRLHPYRPDAYAVAALDYVGQSSFAREPIDWSHYDSAREVFVFGLSTERGRIRSLTGCDEVERLPEFVSWPVKPALEQQLFPTTDLRSAPYVLGLRVEGSVERAHEVAERARLAIRWNTSVDRRAALGPWLGDRFRRGRLKLGWMAQQLLSRFQRTRRSEEAASELSRS